MQRPDWVGEGAMARRRAWSGRRKAAVTWRPSIMGERVFCTAARVATASDRHSAGGSVGCERVQGYLCRCDLVWSGRRVWARRETRMAVDQPCKLSSCSSGCALVVLRGTSSRSLCLACAASSNNLQLLAHQQTKRPIHHLRHGVQR